MNLFFYLGIFLGVVLTLALYAAAFVDVFGQYIKSGDIRVSVFFLYSSIKNFIPPEAGRLKCYTAGGGQAKILYCRRPAAGKLRWLSGFFRSNSKGNRTIAVLYFNFFAPAACYASP